MIVGAYSRLRAIRWRNEIAFIACFITFRSREAGHLPEEMGGNATTSTEQFMPYYLSVDFKSRPGTGRHLRQTWPEAEFGFNCIRRVTCRSNGVACLGGMQRGSHPRVFSSAVSDPQAKDSRRFRAQLRDGDNQGSTCWFLTRLGRSGRFEPVADLHSRNGGS